MVIMETAHSCIIINGVLALLEAVWEIQWIWNFLEELGIINELPTLIYKVNQATIAYASNHHNLVGILSSPMLSKLQCVQVPTISVLSGLQLPGVSSSFQS
jgi:hypothetical protein